MSDPTMNRTAQLVIRTKQPGTDALGNDQFSESIQDVSPCAWQPAGATEDTAGQQHTTDTVTFFGPYTFVGEPNESMILDGARYQITSPVQRWYDDVVPYSTCQLTRVRG